MVGTFFNCGLHDTRFGSQVLSFALGIVILYVYVYVFVSLKCVHALYFFLSLSRAVAVPDSGWSCGRGFASVGSPGGVLFPHSVRQETAPRWKNQ